jgi:glycosyltransferase involved in cell wall biosynthesis
VTACDVAVVIATYRRPGFLPELVGALEAQDIGHDRFEVVVVDDASGDGTAAVLEQLQASSPLTLRVLHQARNAGPGPARHAGVAATTAPLVAFTDDDCLPEPGWLRGLLDAFDDPAVDVVQGSTCPPPAEQRTAGPWDHTIWVSGPSPWFETCNVAYRRSAYERAGGFDHDDPLVNPGQGTHFGEDVVLGARVLATGGRRAFAPAAVVHHRVLPGSFRGHLRERRRLELFPALAERSAPLRDALWHGVFLNRSTALFDLAAAGVAAAALARRPAPLLATVPWAVDRWREARHWTGGGRRAAAPLWARFALRDAVSAAALVRGSLRQRRPLL